MTTWDAAREKRRRLSSSRRAGYHLVYVADQARAMLAEIGSRAVAYG